MYRVRHMYLNADLDAIYEPVLHFLWVLMIGPINFDILAYSRPKKKFSFAHTASKKYHLVTEVS